MLVSVVLGTAFSCWGAMDFSGSAGNFSVGASPGATISDYGSGTPGPAYSLSFDSAGYTSISTISVTFTTTGGWNGDLYASLSHDGGQYAVLLNRVGASAIGEPGYGASGFNNITLAMSGVTDIHGVSAPTTGTYAADGRANYTSSTRANTLDVFSGVNPNGGWTLSFQDMSALEVATLTSFSVNITAVPEPINVALGVFGAVFAAVAVGRRLRTKAQGRA